MSMTEELTAQIDTAIDNVLEKPEEEKVEEKNTEVSDELQIEPDEKNDEVIEKTNAGSDTKNDEKLDSDSSEDQDKKLEAKKEVVVEQPKPVISDQVLASAIQAGLSISEARAFQSDESLMRAVSVLESFKEKVKPKEEEVDPFASIKLDPEKFEPEVIELLGPVLELMKKQQEEIKNLKTQTAEQSKQSSYISQEATVREVTEWFDGQVKKLGDDFSEVLGKGGMNSLKQGTSQHAKREAIAGQVAVMMAGYNASGIKPPPRDELFDVASRIVLRDEYQKISEDKLSGKLEKCSSQHISRVNSRGSESSGDPLDETAKMLDEKYSLRK